MIEAVPEPGKFYWISYVGSDPSMVRAPIVVGTFRAAPYNQPLRLGRWFVVADCHDGFAFADFQIEAGPLVPPKRT